MGPPRTYLPRSKAGTASEVPVSTGPGADTATVAVVRPDASTLAELGVAFGVYEQFPAATCKINTIKGTVHVARVKATGMMWAISGLEPDPSCRIESDGHLVPPTGTGPFGEIPAPPVAAFERGPGEKWAMTTEVGVPFPCPRDPAGHEIVPADVLKAWEIPYYSSMCLPFIPSGPR